MQPDKPKPPATGGVYQKVSSADPMAGAPKNSSTYTPPRGGKFDFILNSNQSKANPLAFIGRVPRPILITILVIVVLFGALFIQSTLSNRGKAWVTDANHVLARQQEILRVNKLAEDLIKDQAVANISATTTATITSDQQQLKAYMKSLKVKVNTKKLGIYIDKSIDAKLKSASQSNTTEAVYTDYLKQKLAVYREQLKQLYTQVGLRGKAILTAEYDGSGLVLQYLPTTKQTD